MNIANLRGGVGETKLKDTIGKLNSKRRRIDFLNECLAEKVVPNSAPKLLKEGGRPFKASAEAWIKESIRKLTDELEIDLNNKKILTKAGIRLPDHVHRELQKDDKTGRKTSERKLRIAISKSKWRSIGRDDITVNLSDKVLSEVEKEVLSLCPKFDTGTQNRDLADWLIANHRWSDPATDQGVMQGLVLATNTSAKGTPSSLLRRYVAALKGLRADESIRLTNADKGGGLSY